MELTPGLRREPAPDLDAVGQDDELVRRIHAEIARTGPMTFARFMELALYDPTGGYYRAGTARPGREGDFLTAPETHPIFGAALARGVEEVWSRLGRPARFVLREYGAGTGTLALAILERLELDGSDLAKILRYDSIEIEPRRLDKIADRLAASGRANALVDPRAGQPTVGLVLANEVLDALPTHRVGFVATASRSPDGSEAGRFVDIEASRRPRPGREAFRRDRAGDGQRGGLSRGRRLGGERGSRSDRGLLLLIDYGYPASELHDPAGDETGRCWPISASAPMTTRTPTSAART
jgi:SAM-dependent MidA family methyltransferase